MVRPAMWTGIRSRAVYLARVAMDEFMAGSAGRNFMPVYMESRHKFLISDCTSKAHS